MKLLVVTRDYAPDAAPLAGLCPRVVPSRARRPARTGRSGPAGPATGEGRTFFNLAMRRR